MERLGRPWLVRIEGTRRNEVFGAGTLLDETYVLTCAHVVGDPESEVCVRVQGRSERAYVAAIVEGCWIPDSPYRQIGDIAVLRLAEPAAGAPRARLRRGWRTGETVRCFGFRAGAQDQGLTAEGRIQDYDLDGERVQLDAVSLSRIARGFSGSAALNRADEICGVVVSVDQGEGNTSWMIDVRALLKHTGRMLRPYLVVGAPPDDPQFTDPRSQPPGRLWSAGHTALRRALSDWLGSDGEDGVVVVGGAAAAAVVTRVVGPTVRAYRDRIGEPDREALPLGSVEAAVDATGKTAAEVAAAIARGLELPVDEGGDLLEGLAALGPPVTIVVNCADQALEPQKLREEVLLPIAVRAPLLRVRLLLGFTGEPWEALRDVVVAGADARPSKEPDGPSAPEKLEEAVQAAAAAERKALRSYAHASPRLLHLPRLELPVAAALRIRLALVRAETDPGQYADASAVLLELSEAAGARSQEFDAPIEKSLAELRRLRDCLDVYHVYAQDRAYERDGRALEEPGLSALYNKAHTVLYGGLVDLERARRYVRRYVKAVRRLFPNERS